jgi:hypothetical protein
MTDRLQSPSPVRNAGPEKSPRGDPQQQGRKRPPKPENTEETPETPEDQDSHQIDELA